MNKKIIHIECGINQFSKPYRYPAKTHEDIEERVNNCAQYMAEKTIGWKKISVLIYARDPNMQHANLQAGYKYQDSDGFYIPIPEVYDIPFLVEKLNQNKIPFNLAINSPIKKPISSYIYDWTTGTLVRNGPDRISLSPDELISLENLADTGAKYGVTNSVTIALDELLAPIKKEFPNLEVFASCLHPATRSNIDKFDISYGISWEDTGYWIEYYNDLYRRYDKVVISSQLTTTGFLKHFQKYNDRTILFLNLHCSNTDLGHCAWHYGHDLNNYDNPVYPRMPMFPDIFYSKTERKTMTDATCNLDNNWRLIKRPKTLTQVIRWNFNRFKMPARNDADENFAALNVLAKAITK